MTDTKDIIQFAAPDEAASAVADVCCAASRYIRIFSQTLHPMLYGQKEVVAALSKMARKSRFSSIRVIVVDPRPLFGKDVPLIHLHQRLSSKIDVRVYVDGAPKEDVSYLCVDQNHHVSITNEENAEGVVHWHDRALAKRQADIFDHLWENGCREEPNFKRLQL